MNNKKKTDKKQNELITELKQNQLALTSGLKDLVEANRDILTLNRDLPHLLVVQILKRKRRRRITKEITSTKRKKKLKPNNYFKEIEIEFLKETYLEPNELLKMNEEQLDAFSKDVIEDKKK